MNGGALGGSRESMTREFRVRQVLDVWGTPHRINSALHSLVYATTNDTLIHSTRSMEITRNYSTSEHGWYSRAGQDSGEREVKIR